MICQDCVVGPEIDVIGCGQAGVKRWAAVLYVTLRTLGIRGSGNMTRSVNKDLKHDLVKEKKKKVLYVIIDSNQPWDTNCCVSAFGSVILGKDKTQRTTWLFLGFNRLSFISSEANGIFFSVKVPKWLQLKEWVWVAASSLGYYPRMISFDFWNKQMWLICDYDYARYWLIW